MRDFIKINEKDDVIVALRTISAGEKMEVPEGEITALEEIPEETKGN